MYFGSKYFIRYFIKALLQPSHPSHLPGNALHVRKVLILMKSKLSVLSFLSPAFEIASFKESMLTLRLPREFPTLFSRHHATLCFMLSNIIHLNFCDSYKICT